MPQVGALGRNDRIHDKGAQIAQHGPQQACLSEAQASVGPIIRGKAGDQDLHLGHQAGERLRRRGGQAGHRLKVAIVSRVVLRPCLSFGSATNTAAWNCSAPVRCAAARARLTGKNRMSAMIGIQR